MKKVGLISLMFILTACVGGEYSGTGPITFSDRAVRIYDSYISRSTPMAMAVTMDGKDAFYYFCPWNYQGSCEHLADTQTLYQCQEATGKECRIFARGNEIVWENPGDWRNGVPEGKYLVDHAANGSQ